MVFPITSRPDCCINDSIFYITATNIASISGQLVKRYILCPGQLRHKMYLPDRTTAWLGPHREVEMADTWLKRLVIAFYEVRCKNHRTTKFLEADKQLAAHGGKGPLRALGDF